MSAHVATAAQAAAFRFTAMSSSRRPQRYTDARRADKLSRRRGWHRARTVIRLLAKSQGVSRDAVSNIFSKIVVASRSGLEARSRATDTDYRLLVPLLLTSVIIQTVYAIVRVTTS